MSKKKERRRQAERERRALHHAKASVGAVLEQCSVPELAVLIRFFEREDMDAVVKLGILESAASDIRAAWRTERLAERAAARKLSRVKPQDGPMPQVPIPDSARPEH